MTSSDASALLLPPGDNPDVVIDLSNVCRDQRFPDNVSYWARYLRVLQAVERRFGRRPRGVAFADANLRSMLSNVEVRAFDREEQRGCLRVVRGDADVDLLVCARDTGASVVSRDGYSGHRETHPWIQGDTSRFVGWRPDGERVLLHTRKMGVRSPFSISEGQESDRMKGAQVKPETDRDMAVLMHAFKCENPSCVLARKYPNHLEEPPNMRRGIPRCPECGQPLADLGPRDGSVEFVLEIGDVELRRLSLKPGDEVVIGRGEIEGPARRRQVNENVGRVSRKHVTLAVTADGAAVVTDMGSRNGSTLVAWRQGDAGWSDPSPMESNRQMVLSPREAVLLADVVRLRRSGQQYALAERGKPVVLGAVDEAMTRFADEEDE